MVHLNFQSVREFINNCEPPHRCWTNKKKIVLNWRVRVQHYHVVSSRVESTQSANWTCSSWCKAISNDKAMIIIFMVPCRSLKTRREDELLCDYQDCPSKTTNAFKCCVIRPEQRPPQKSRARQFLSTYVAFKCLFCGNQSTLSHTRVTNRDF